MDGETDWVVSDEVMNAAVGKELRLAREAAGLTRPELVDELPFTVSVATLANYESGKRAVSYRRLLEFSRVTRVDAWDILRRAIERVEAIQSLLVEVDLQVIAYDDDPRFVLLQRWAKTRLEVAPTGTTIVRLHHSVLREFATMLDISAGVLVKHLEACASLRQVSGPASTPS